MHRGRAIRPAAGPHRWWLALDRQAGPFGGKVFSIPNGPLRLFPSHPPPVAGGIITAADAADGGAAAHWERL
jgi:hypothetical protein